MENQNNELLFTEIIFCRHFDKEKYLFTLTEEENNKSIDLEKLVKYMDNMIPKFALKKGEDPTNKSDRLRRIMKTDKKEEHPKYAELMLFCFLEEHFKIPKFVTKIIERGRFGANQVTGFDCAHITRGENNIPELWLGESKFYQDYKSALRKVFNQFKKIDSDFLDNICSLNSNYQDSHNKSTFSEEEIENILGYLSGENNNSQDINLIFPIFILTDRDSNSVEKQKQEIFNFIVKKYKESPKNINRINATSFKFLIFPIKSVYLLRKCIEEKSLYAK